MAVPNFANSPGWNDTNPKLNQDVAPLTLLPIIRTKRREAIEMRYIGMEREFQICQSKSVKTIIAMMDIPAHNNCPPKGELKDHI